VTDRHRFPDSAEWRRLLGGGSAPARQRRHQVDADAGFDVLRFSGAATGPRVVVLGGVHGDEVTGIVAAGLLARIGVPLIAGTLTVVPVAHEAAAAVAARVSPHDGGNLARTFPGDPAGGPTARLAHRLARDVLDHADLAIDLHTAGRRYDMPFLAGFRNGSVCGAIDATALAAAFGAEYVWEHPELAPGRTISHVEQRGGVGLYVESLGGERLDPLRVRSYVAGVMRVLAALGMVQLSPELLALPVTPARRVRGDGDVDATELVAQRSGYFVPAADAGGMVGTGGLLGVLVDSRGEEIQRLVCPRSSTVMMMRRAAAVEQGEMLVVLAVSVPEPTE
jgi:predicted deacylase